MKTEHVSFVFLNDIPSKKNSKQIFQRAGRPFIVSSERYTAWEEEQMWLLKSYKGKTIVECDKILAIFCFDTDRRKDLSNLWESVGDLLVKAKILADDSFKVIPDLELVYGGKLQKSQCNVEIINPRYE